MKIKSLIKQITGEDIIETEDILTGLTNHNLHVTTETKQLVLRLPKPENKHLFNYKHEAYVLKLIKPLNLEPATLYYDANSGIKCSLFIEDAKTLSKDTYLEATKLIAKLHNANLTSGETFNLQAKYDLYKAENPVYDLSPYQHYISEAQNLGTHIRLCHNDCVEGNFLFTPTQSYLIDYEYASDNDPYFDLLSLITENDITDEDIKQQIILLYFSLVDIPYDQSKLKVYEGALHTLWCAWACSMYETFKEPIFKEIADLKYQRLTEL